MEWALRVANHEGAIDEEAWGGELQSLLEEQSVVKAEGSFEDNVIRHIEILAQMNGGLLEPLD
jgi:hypothetical protein